MELIYGLVFKAWSWVPWVLGLGTLGWIALALLAPGVLSVISPILRGLSEGIVEVFKILYEGTTDILDNWKTVVTAFFLVWLTINYVTWKEAPGYERPAQVKQSPPKKTQVQKEKPTFSLDGWDWFHSK